MNRERSGSDGLQAHEFSSDPKSAQERPAQGAGAARDRDEISARSLERFRDTGEARFFEIFYRINRKEVLLRLARSRAAGAWSFNHGQMADDIFHDIYRSAGNFSYQGAAAFRSWIRVVIHNKIRKAILRARRAPCPLPGGGSAVSDMGASDPLERLVAAEERQAALRACALLLWALNQGLTRTPEPERSVLLLQACEGLTYQRIMERTGLARKEVALALRRGRRKVARMAARFLQRSALSPRGD